MQQHGAAAGIPEQLRHPHILRHTCASDLAEKKVQIEKNPG